MSDYISGHQIRRIFSNLCHNEIELPLSFYNELLKITENLKPIMDILQQHRISLESSHQRLLFRKYANAIFSQAYYCLKLVIQSRKKFNSKIVAITELHQNYHASNVMHQPVQKLLETISSLENFILVPQLIEKRHTFFCYDNMHLTRYGAKTLFYRIQDLIRIIAKFFLILISAPVFRRPRYPHIG